MFLFFGIFTSWKWSYIIRCDTKSRFFYWISMNDICLDEIFLKHEHFNLLKFSQDFLVTYHTLQMLFYSCFWLLICDKHLINSGFGLILRRNFMFADLRRSRRLFVMQSDLMHLLMVLLQPFERVVACV